MCENIKDVKYIETYGRIESLPMLALRGLSVFPEMTMNFDVERGISVNAINKSNAGTRLIFLVTQKDILKETPGREDLYTIGTICILKQFIRTQSGGMRVMVEGKCRARLLNIKNEDGYFQAEVCALPVNPMTNVSPKVSAYIRQALNLYEDYSALTGNNITESIISLAVQDNPGYVADYIAQNMFLKHTEKQLILETLQPVKRLQLVINIIARENEILTIEQDINQKLHEQFSKAQKENILREQMRIIKAELGEDDENSEIDTYREKIYALNLQEDVEKKLIKETERLSKQSFGSAESSVIRSYLDVCLELPWNKKTQERLNISAVRKILDEDHFGLDKVKERIIEFLAVKQLAPDIKSSILCFVGPPGVGKTSIAISIAKAMNRKLARMSLGGVHDEAEIRGHRKTYVGAMPGRIINAVTQSGSMNPLILLDEIDKLGLDHRGDPASALLEALDPEQNATFRDHYLEIPFDLSDVFFITTANTTDTIPRPLLDRMEIIELTSYTDEEKLQIAKNYLFPKQRRKHGMNGRQLRLNDDVIRDIIAGYTKESGVRQLEREIAAVCRKAAALIAGGVVKSVNPKTNDLEKLLGVRKYKTDELNNKDEIGVVRGLAWTSVGGEILDVEVSILEGSGKLELTGNLGNVMKESAQTAVSYIRSRANILGIDPDFYKKKDIHIHFPEGAVPKDGPSAGITIATAVISALAEKPVKKDIAMTGEITLRGRILPIGGLKEKTMAALRSGIRTVIIPFGNEHDLEEIDQTVRRALNFIVAENIDDILDIVMDFSHIPVKQDNVENNLESGIFQHPNEQRKPSPIIRQ